MVSSTGGGPDGAAEAVPASPSAADANAPAAMEVKRIFMVVPSFCSVTHDEYLLLLFMSVRHSSQRPFCAHAPLGCNRRYSCGFGCFPGHNSQTEAVKPTDGGILNSKALELPAPQYPAEAKRVHASGEVQVQVLIDETGKVVTAYALFGPESLRPAAVAAAKQARFAPTVVEGVTVKVSGIITYDFKAQ